MKRAGTRARPRAGTDESESEQNLLAVGRVVNPMDQFTVRTAWMTDDKFCSNDEHGG